MNLQKVLFLPKNILKCNLHTSAAMNKIQAGRYKVTRDRSKPLTYEQSFWPEQIAIKKGSWLKHTLYAGLSQAEGRGTVCWIKVKVAVLCAQQYMPWNLNIIKVLNNFWYFKYQILTRICSDAYLKYYWRNWL